MRHPPPFELDRYAAGELSQDAEVEIEEHVESCESCNSYLKNIAVDREALLFRVPAATFAYRIESLASRGEGSTRWYGSGVWKAATAAVAATATCVLIWMSFPSNETASTRWMGSAPVVQIYLNRNGNTQTIDELIPIARDRLRYKVTLPPGKRAYAALVGIEGNDVLPLLPGRIDYEPFPVSGETFLPGSVEIEPGGKSSVLLLIVREERFSVRDIVNEVRDATTVSPEKIDVPGVANRLRIAPGSP